MEGTNPVFAPNKHQPDSSGQYQSDSSGAAEFGLDASSHSAPTTNSTPTNTPPDVEVTVEDLVFLNVPLSWQEAAAIVVELASVVPPGAPWPDPAHAILTDTGAILPAPQVTIRGNPVCHAASLLERLLVLTRIAPAELKVLVNKNVGETPALGSLDSFRKALNYFTRPSRLDDTAAVHGRAADLLQKRLLEREFDRLRHKSERGGHRNASVASGLLGRVDPELLQGALVALLCLLLAGSGAVLVWMAVWPMPRFSAPSQTSTPRQADSPLPAEASKGSGPSNAPAGSPGGAASGHPSTPTPAVPRAPTIRIPRSLALQNPPPAPPQTSTHSTPATRSGVGAEGDARRDRFWSVTVREVGPDGEPLATREGPPAASRERSHELFSAVDTDVQPAALVRPQMPSVEPAVAPDQRDSVFDLIVDQDGRVEQVRLVSPGNRFNDRMLIAAAKAWQFQPATKDGQPVRYKLQVRIAP